MTKWTGHRCPVKRMLLGDSGGPATTRDLSSDESYALVGVVKARLDADNRILLAYLHGSFLGDLPSHDVDVAVYLREGLSGKDRVLTCLTLGSELSYKTGVPVDVHSIDPEDLAFSFDAISGVVLLSRDEELRDRFEERTVALYMDFRPVMKQTLRDLASGPER